MAVVSLFSSPLSLRGSLATNAGAGANVVERRKIARGVREQTGTVAAHDFKT